MTLRVLESKFRDHFSIQTSPQNPQKATSGTQIGPQKVIFGHFAFFEHFSVIFQSRWAIFFKIESPQLNKFFMVANISQVIYMYNDSKKTYRRNEILI